MLQKKYKVSLSTLADKSIFVLLKYVDHTKLLTEKIKVDGGKKTSIKTRIFKEALNNLNHKQRAILSENCLRIYINKLIQNYTDKPEKVYSEIDNELKQANDMYFEYNARIRSTTRALQTNKEYFKKLLEQV